MPDIKHSILIDAPPERVFSLVATGAGLARWWAADITEASGVVEIGFFNRATVYRLRPVNMASPSDAEWVCDTGKEWTDTRLIFRLSADGARTRVRFTHAGWQGETDYFVDCTTTWGGLMFRLRAAAEHGTTAPLFSHTGLAS